MSREHMLSYMPHTHFPDKEGKHQYAFGIEQEEGSCTGRQRLVSCLGLLEGGLCSSYADQDEGLSKCWPTVFFLCPHPSSPGLLPYCRERQNLLSTVGGLCVWGGRILIVFPAREVMI